VKIKQTLEFENIEEYYRYLANCKGNEWKMAMEQFYTESLRQRVKYGDEAIGSHGVDLVSTIKDEFFAILKQFDLNLE